MNRISRKAVDFYLDICNNRLHELGADIELHVQSSYGDYRIIDTNYNDISKRGNLRNMYDQLHMLSNVLDSMKAGE